MPHSDEFERLIADSLGLPNRDSGSPALALAERAFLSAHFQRRTAAQETAIPIVLSGRDLLLAAPTASGKTEAAFIPIVAQLLGDRSDGLCVYVAPTRALLNDIAARIAPPLERTRLKFAVRHGDSPLPARREDIAFLLTTPESLDYLLRAAPNLVRRARWAILDEIHQLFGTARGEQLRLLMRRLELLSGRHIQTIAMSATVADPTALRDWLFNGNPAELQQVEAKRELDVELRYGSPATCLRQALNPGDYRKVLVFANSRRRCEELHQAIDGAGVYDTFVHYSSLSRSERLAVERGFARAGLAVCIATSTLELGVDIGSVDLVVLADPPGNVASFLQRVGRGGRRGARSKAICIAESPESLLLAMAGALLATEGRLESRTGGPRLGAAVQQIFSYIASKANHRAHPSEFERLFSETGDDLPEHLQPVLDSLVGQSYLEFDPVWNSYTIGPALAVIIDSPAVHSNILDAGDGIPVYSGKRSIGSLSAFPHEVSEGQVMVMGGRYWEVVRSDPDRMTVLPSAPVASAVTPRWNSRRGVIISGPLARKCGELVASQGLAGQLALDEESERLLDRLNATLGRAAATSIPYWRTTGGSVESVTFAGDLGNAVLSLLFKESGVNCRPTKGRRFMSLVSNRPLSPAAIPSERRLLEDLVQGHWRALATYAEQGSFSSLLPATQRKSEILAQVTGAELLDFMVEFRNKKAVHVGVPWT